jgi:hypothetical protein
MTSQYDEIITRLREAKGPLSHKEAMEVADILFAEGTHEWMLLAAALEAEVQAVGSALALVEKLLPGWVIEVKQSRLYGWYVTLVGPEHKDWPSKNISNSGWVKRLEQAVLLALFKALQSKEAGNG